MQIALSWIGMYPEVYEIQMPHNNAVYDTLYIDG